MFEFSVSKHIEKTHTQIIKEERDQRARRWGANPKIASPMTSMLHKKGGGSREGIGTFMSNANHQETKNQY